MRLKQQVRILTSDAVTSVGITAGGTAYIVPAVTFSAPDSGTTATGTAVLNNGVVSSITIIDGGSGYTTAPTATLQNPPKTQSNCNHYHTNGTVKYNHRSSSGV